jgi:PAS domain-containing protein
MKIPNPDDNQRPLTSDQQKGQPANLSDVDEQFRLFIEGVEEYAFILYSPDNRISRWNKGAEHLTGFTEAEVLGQSGSILFTPEDRANGQAKSFHMMLN